jgi:hypothetical protein
MRSNPIGTDGAKPLNGARWAAMKPSTYAYIASVESMRTPICWARRQAVGRSPGGPGITS